ncbi:DUF2790 domain-containing protein [Pseudomonas sp. 148P]|uniref:DUF2790 domain-containing protein n=1 Tax=Pseudomonas ulcerans TaxID=3115852 RepID=A0ABU7HWC6_9PSED|nr:MULTISPECIES: DUF2790 domain-containing protein [unclassified Pseudomonas]MEE1924614.1 DUF2790 domain-containing protein [Pseudomonas sp. 147P]MEE1935872.1 DUF2790 domain-containing protein [Pseudomonas sp. 148P]
MKLRVMLLPLLLLSAAAQATQAPVPMDYRYGMHLDVAKVLDLREPATDYQCKVVVATMTYLDSKGQERALNYRKLSSGCTDQG